LATPPVSSSASPTAQPKGSGFKPAAPTGFVRAQPTRK
jgi:hypothetical protein